MSTQNTGLPVELNITQSLTLPINTFDRNFIIIGAVDTGNSATELVDMMPDHLKSIYPNSNAILSGKYFSGDIATLKTLDSSQYFNFYFLLDRTETVEELAQLAKYTTENDLKKVMTERDSPTGYESLITDNFNFSIHNTSHAGEFLAPAQKMTIYTGSSRFTTTYYSEQDSNLVSSDITLIEEGVTTYYLDQGNNVRINIKNDVLPYQINRLLGIIKSSAYRYWNEISAVDGVFILNERNLCAFANSIFDLNERIKSDIEDDKAERLGNYSFIQFSEYTDEFTQEVKEPLYLVDGDKFLSIREMTTSEKEALFKKYEESRQLILSVRFKLGAIIIKVVINANIER